MPPFNIPNLRIEQRKTSSAEDMARKNSIGRKKRRSAVVPVVEHVVEQNIVYREFENARHKKLCRICRLKLAKLKFSKKKTSQSNSFRIAGVASL